MAKTSATSAFLNLPLRTLAEVEAERRAWEIIDAATKQIEQETGHNGGTGSGLFRSILALHISGGLLRRVP